MLIRLKAPASLASGKQGTDIVYLPWRETQCARAYAIPRNPNTVAQQAVRGILTDLSKRWQTLTKEQRGTWKTYADGNPRRNRLGEEFLLPALPQYIATNTAARMFTATYQDTAPTVSAPPPVTEIIGAEYDAQNNELYVTFTHPAFTTPTTAALFLFAAGSPALRISEPLLRVASFPFSAAFGACAASPQAATTLATSNLSTFIEVGMLFHIGVRVYNAQFAASQMVIAPIEIAAMT